jgi:hypothetical protein
VPEPKFGINKKRKHIQEIEKGKNMGLLEILLLVQIVFGITFVGSVAVILIVDWIWN